MADNEDHYNEISRESCVYVSAEIQGNLERKRVLGGKSKHWCSLQGSTLYLQKKQGDVIETIDLQDANFVKKMASEYTGTHFEINMKKKRNHIFICPSSENCTEWVNALQTALDRKNSSHHGGHKDDTAFSDNERSIYSEVDEAFMTSSDHCIPHQPRINPKVSPKLSDYTEPCDAERDSGKRDNDYWEIGDLRRSQAKLPVNQEPAYDGSESATYSSCTATKQTISMEESSNKQSADLNYEDVESDRAAETSSSQNAFTPDYAQVKKFSTSKETADKITKVTSDKTELCASDLLSVSTSSSSDVNTCSDLHTSLNFPETEDGQIKIEANSEDSGLFQILAEALSEFNCPVEDYIHPLSDEDWKPLDDLTDFLKKNVNVCRVSYSSVPINNDPVSSLKIYLGSLEASLKKIDKNIFSTERPNPKSATTVHNA